MNVDPIPGCGRLPERWRDVGRAGVAVDGEDPEFVV
jgi:hypothetical protein